MRTLKLASSSTFFLILLLASPLFASDKANIPDWVKQAAAQTLPSYPPDTDAVVLLDDTTYTVNGPGDYVEHYRHVSKILRPSGRDEGTLAVHTRAAEKVNSVHGWSIDSDGHEYELKYKDFTEAMPYSGALYTDIKFRMVKAPAANPGTVIGFEYDVHRHGFLNALDWDPQDTNPVRLATLTLQLPSGYEYKDVWGGMPPVKVQSLGGNRWQWTMNDLPRIEDEPHRPSAAALTGRMEIKYFGTGNSSQSENWNALGIWYNGLSADRRNLTPEVADKVHLIIAGKNGFDAKARALTEFMQNEIRYVGIEIGIGGYQPHPAADIFRYRYGDCKDKATLLSTMLREAGIASDYVLIHTVRGVVRQEMPSSGFNHAILAIELPADAEVARYHAVFTASGKKYLLFDPTDEFTPLGDIAPHSQDRYALLVTATGGELIHTPILDPDANRLVRRGTFTLTPTGSLSGEVTEKRIGDSASQLRHGFTHSTDLEREHFLENSLARSVATAKLQNIKLESLDQRDKELVTRYEIASDRYAQLSGPLMLVRPRVIGKLAFGLEKKERKYPVELHATARDEDEYEIEIPTGFVVDDIPEPVKVDSGFGTYESQIKVTGSKISYKRTYISKTLEVPTDKLAEFRAFQNRIAEDENSVVVLKRGN